MPGKSTHLQVIPQQNTQKHSKFAIRDMREKSVDFFLFTTQASILALAIILLTQVPLQKFPFLFSLNSSVYILSRRARVACSALISSVSKQLLQRTHNHVILQHLHMLVLLVQSWQQYQDKTMRRLENLFTAPIDLLGHFSLLQRVASYA